MKWDDPFEVTPRWKPEPSVGGMGRPKRRRALNVSSQRKQEIRAKKAQGCRLCDRTVDVQAHHLVPRGMGGTIGGEWTESNVVGLCRYCHQLVEQRDRAACHLLRTLLTDAEYAYVSGKMGEDWLDRRYPAIGSPRPGRQTMTDLARELREALDDPKRGEWGGYPWEHLGDAERDVRVLLAECERLRAALREERRKRHLWAKGQFWWGARGGRQ